jgi:hypothetical protein
MRHVIGLGAVLLLVAPGGTHAAGTQQPPCFSVTWVATGSMSTPRVDHAATLLPSGKVLVAGGSIAPAGRGLASAELYDPATGTWTLTGSMNVARWGHTMTLLSTGKVLVAGGFDTSATATAELYDPDTGQWSMTGAMLEARYDQTATLLSTGDVLVAGGVANGFLATAELYDPTTGQWHATASLPAVRVDHTATLLPSGQVVVLGGLSNDGHTASAELYDPAAGTWMAGPPMLTGRDLHTATRLESGAVLVAGGFGNPPPGFDTPVLTDAELSDPASGAFRRTGSLLAPHAGHTATRLDSGRVLVVDGLSAGPATPPIPNTELFDPASETWSNAGCSVEARVSHTATLLPSGAVLVAGGTSGTSSTGNGTSSAELYGIVVSPTQVTLAPGASQTFTASKGSGLGFVWSFRQNNSGGTLSAAGDYQAGSVGGVTDVLQVKDSLDNAATVTVTVTQRPGVAVSATSPQAKAMGCGATAGSALPALAGAVVLLLGWTRRRGALR